MKESTLLEMKNKIQSLTNVVQYLMNEAQSTKTLSIGTFETIKLMPGYEEALGKIKEKAKQEKENGVIEQDSK
jgi:hypothetical protein